MIQFNLLPDVKVEFIKARRSKRLVLLAAVGLIGVCGAVIATLAIVVFVWQNISLRDLDRNIKASANDLRSQPDINKVLTVQNQLVSIDGLHSQKPEVGRVFEYLAQVTPSRITVQTLMVNFVTPAVAITGQAPSLEEVNKYVDTLKFTTISKDKNDQNVAGGDRAFSSVVLSAYSLDVSGASFTITLAYDPVIFDSSETGLNIIVPQITSTRSRTEQPASLFKENVTPLESTTP